MKRFFPLIATLLVASTVQADPFCTQLLDKAALPKKYAKIAPIYSDASSGWIFTQDQLKDRYDMKATSQRLVQEIVDEFAKRNVHLAIVVAPPRPIVAGQVHLDAAMNPASYDLGAAQASFDKLIKGLDGTGAVVPNLSDVALSDPALRASFYFHRDTHWTPTGSAASALALAQAVNARFPDLYPQDGVVTFGDLNPSDSIEEKGSLSGVVKKVCATSPAIETAVTFDLARSGGLLDDSAGTPSIALLGSSFSNRYQTDHYRFAEALERAFDADVENFSVSGGGPIGAIEAYVLSGALDRREHPLVIWELPYTESFNASSFLRQLLGALQQERSPKNTVQTATGADAISVQLPKEAKLSGIEIIAEDLSKQAFRLEVRFDNGSTSKVSLQRRSHMPVEMRKPSLFANLEHFGDRRPVEIIIAPKKGSTVSQVALF